MPVLMLLSSAGTDYTLTEKPYLWKRLRIENMKIEEAIVYVLAERNGGLRTEQIAEGRIMLLM